MAWHSPIAWRSVFSSHHLDPDHTYLLLVVTDCQAMSLAGSHHHLEWPPQTPWCRQGVWFSYEYEYESVTRLALKTMKSFSWSLRGKFSAIQHAISQSLEEWIDSWCWLPHWQSITESSFIHSRTNQKKKVHTRDFQFKLAIYPSQPIYIYICVCVCVSIPVYLYPYIYTFQTTKVISIFLMVYQPPWVVLYQSHPCRRIGFGLNV